MIQKSWKKVLIGPLLGLLVAPVVSLPLIYMLRYFLWANGHHMPGKVFVGAVSISVIGAVYSVFFVCFGAIFAPSHRKETASVLYLLGCFLTVLLLKNIGSPIEGAEPMWQPLTFTLLGGSIAYFVFLITEGRKNAG